MAGTGRSNIRDVITKEIVISRTNIRDVIPKEIVKSRTGFGSQKRTYKIIVVGDSNVGKTCLTYRFCEGRFLNKSEATIGVDFRERSVDVNGEDVKLQLWDTAGQERFRKSMVQHYYRNVHAVVLVYDVTKLSSFQSLPLWITECNKHNLTSDIPRILVGNKCDCKEEQVVKTNTAQKFADLHNMPLFETSARDETECDNVEAIFLTLAHKLKNQKQMMTPALCMSSNDALDRADVIEIKRESTKVFRESTNVFRESTNVFSTSGGGGSSSSSCC